MRENFYEEVCYAKEHNGEYDLEKNERIIYEQGITCAFLTKSFLAGLLTK